MGTSEVDAKVKGGVRRVPGWMRDLEKGKRLEWPEKLDYFEVLSVSTSQCQLGSLKSPLTSPHPSSQTQVLLMSCIHCNLTKHMPFI